MPEASVTSASAAASAKVAGIGRSVPREAVGCTQCWAHYGSIALSSCPLS